MLFDFKNNVPFPAPIEPKFKFIDLFAGIGGFRIAHQNLGGKCVFTSEWDKYSKQTYKANFVKYHLVILQNWKPKHIYLIILMFYAQVSLVKHFQLQVKEVVLKTLEEHCFLMSQK